MANLEKKTLVGLLEKSAGTKLYNLLNPCCQPVIRYVIECDGENVIITGYVTFPSGTNGRSFVLGLTSLPVDPISGVVEANPGEEIQFGSIEIANPGVGSYDVFTLAYVNGQVPIVQSGTITISCS